MTTFRRIIGEVSAPAHRRHRRKRHWWSSSTHSWKSSRSHSRNSKW
jgi:hypothetical protein